MAGGIVLSRNDGTDATEFSGYAAHMSEVFEELPEDLHEGASESHMINWKDEEVVHDFIQSRIQESLDQLKHTAEECNWSQNDIDDLIQDLQKVSLDTWNKIKPSICQYELRSEEEILDFILSIHLRWGTVVFENNSAYVQMVKDYACYGKNYTMSYDDYAEKVRDYYKSARSGSSNV